MAFLEDEEKQLLLERYFDIEWCDDVSDLRCVRCHRVAINHCVSSCHHLFCRTCSKFYSDKLHLKCPQCQKHITHPDCKDFDVEVKIHQLGIFCPNKKYGCKHADQLRKIPSHLLTCTCTKEAALPGKASVVAQLTSLNDGDLRERTREVYNKVEEKLSELKTKTDKTDSKFKQFEKKTDEIHRKVKALTTKITNVNKKVKGMELASKKCTEQFKSMKSLLESINQRVQKIESIHRPTSSNVDGTQDSEAIQYKESKELNIQKAQTYEWTITDVKKCTVKEDWTIESDVFRFIGYEFDIKAEIEQTEGTITIYLQFKDGETINELVENGGFTKVKYIIRDQENIETRKDMILESELWFFYYFSHPDWILGQGLSRAILYPPYTKDDCIKISISLEPPSIDRSFVSTNGILMWTVDNYTKTKQEVWRFINWSPSFYTSPQGYRVKARIFINDSQPMKLAVYFLTGEYDDSLSIYWRHKTTVTLFNQLDPSMNLVKSKQSDDVIPYSMEFVSSRVIEENGFFKDGSLLLKVVIEP